MFIYQYLKHPKRTGALCSSSKGLSCAMTKDVQKALNIIEIGPGTGAFTRKILEQKDARANFFAVEINEKMAQILSKKLEFSDIEIGNALFLNQMLKKRNMQEAQLIISGIPWALLKNEEQTRLLQSIYESLSNGGEFRTFAYILPTLKAKRFKNKLFDLFKEVEISKIIWQNIPPAFVYYCRK